MVASVVGSGIALLLTFHVIINAFLLRRPLPSRRIDESVALLIPCRNEEQNVVELLKSLQAQRDLSDFEIFLLDDNSSDRTLERARSVADARTQVVSGSALPDGWLGKPFACHQLSKLASGADLLAFIDADVRLAPTAISQSIATMRGAGLSLVSPYPEQLAQSWSERLLQPLLHWSWLATLPLRIAERSTRTSLSAANGQLLLVDAKAYRATGGHEAIKDRVLDDIELLKNFKRHKYFGGVIDGSEIAKCRMYTNWREVEMGYSKWLWAAFGSPWVSLLSAGFLALTFLVPLISWDRFALASYLAGVVGRLVSAVRTKGRILDALFHPLSILALIVLMASSWWRKYRGTTAWKERVLQ